MKQKFFRTLFIAALSVSVFTGCGKPGGNGQTEGNSREASGAKEAKDKQDGIEKVVMYLPAAANVTDLDMVTEEINKISRDKINTEIAIKTYDFGQWFQQYSLFLSGTENVDILVNYGGYANAVSQGAALDLSSLIQEYGQDILAVEGEYIKSGQINGLQYAIPVYSCYANNLGIIYRADIVKELGLEDEAAGVKTLEDWENILAAVKEAYPEMTPFVTISGNSAYNFQVGTWDSLSNDYGVLMNGGETSEVVNLFETDEYAGLCNIMYDWYQKGYSSKDIQTQTDGYMTLVKNDAAFSTIGQVDFNAAFYQSTVTGKDIGAITLEEPFTKSYTNVTYTIMSNTKHPEAAMKFLNLWFSDTQVADLMNYGIEGVHYKVNENGTASYADGQDASSCTYHMGRSINNCNGIRWESENPEYASLLKDDNDSAKRSIATGFNFDAESVTNEITQLDNVCSKYWAGLECGALNPADYLDTFNEELKAAGLETVINEKQAQLDKWLSDNQE